MHNIESFLTLSSFLRFYSIFYLSEVYYLNADLNIFRNNHFLFVFARFQNARVIIFLNTPLSIEIYIFTIEC